MRVLSIHSPKKSLLTKSYLKNNRDLFVRFLPSIALYKTDNEYNTYLLSYRIWRKKVTPLKKPAVMTDNGHPWKHAWGKLNASNYDSSAYALLKIKKNNASKISVEQEYIPSNRTTKIDMRLLPVPKQKNKYYATFNTYGLLNPKIFKKDYNNMKTNVRPQCFYYKDSSGKVHKKTSAGMFDKNNKLSPKHKTLFKMRDRWCTFQMRATMTLLRKKSLKTNTIHMVPKFTNLRLVCALHHARHEKNIQTFITRSGKPGYQYSINPWVFFDETCKKLTSAKDTLFSKIVNFYDSRTSLSPFQRKIQFSCSTPLIDFDSDSYIAVGHYKIQYRETFKPNSPIDMFLRKAAKLMKVKKLKYEGLQRFIHPEYVYGMFLYTVDKKTLGLKKVSDAFIPLDKSYKQLLSFPSGITKHSDDTFLISYHENDITIKLLELKISEIKKMLKYVNNTQPNTYDFDFIHL